MDAMNEIKKMKTPQTAGGKCRMLLLAMAAVLTFASCQKESDYYLDSGLSVPAFNGTVEDYLASQPFYFDSITAIIKLAGMDSIFQDDTVTFFAPTDRSVLRLIQVTNALLYGDGRDTIQTLDDVPPLIWRKYLSRYLFHGRNMLKDYPQIDYDLLPAFPGQGYLSWDGTPMNIGVIFNDAQSGTDNKNVIKYAGYRQLSIAYIPDLAHPTERWIHAEVASSNISTNNGAVHVMNDNHTFFGFAADEFYNDMEAVLSSAGVN